MGIYAASKHAVEGYTETLDHEVRTIWRARGVGPTGLYEDQNQRERASPPSLPSKFMPTQRKRMNEVVEEEVEHGDDPRIVAEAVWKALTAKSPRLRYPVARVLRLSRLRRFVPAGMFDRSLRKQFQLH